jgi:hypothetical protein
MLSCQSTLGCGAGVEFDLGKSSCCRSRLSARFIQKSFGCLAVASCFIHSRFARRQSGTLLGSGTLCFSERIAGPCKFVIKRSQLDLARFPAAPAPGETFGRACHERVKPPKLFVVSSDFVPDPLDIRVRGGEHLGSAALARCGDCGSIASPLQYRLDTSDHVGAIEEKLDHFLESLHPSLCRGGFCLGCA